MTTPIASPRTIPIPVTTDMSLNWIMKNLIWILAAIMLAGCGDNEEGQDMGLHGDPPGYSLFIW